MIGRGWHVHYFLSHCTQSRGAWIPQLLMKFIEITSKYVLNTTNCGNSISLWREYCCICTGRFGNAKAFWNSMSAVPGERNVNLQLPLWKERGTSLVGYVTDVLSTTVPRTHQWNVSRWSIDVKNRFALPSKMALSTIFWVLYFRVSHSIRYGDWKSMRFVWKEEGWLIILSSKGKKTVIQSSFTRSDGKEEAIRKRNPTYVHSECRNS